MSTPIVSILCITYNHQQFIRTCLESLVAQKCDFPFEIIIYDDASTDGTRDVIIEFQEKYPELIRAILRQEHQWSKNPGVIDILSNNPQAKGDYLTICEGYDLWIGQDQLQKQVAILEEHPECSMTCGAYLLIDESKEEVVRQNKWLTEYSEDERGRIFELEDLKHTFFIKTSTTLFRNQPALFEQLKRYELCLDMHVFYVLLRAGTRHYNNEVMGGYNRHKDGAESGSQQQQTVLAQYLTPEEKHERDDQDGLRHE